MTLSKQLPFKCYNLKADLTNHANNKGTGISYSQKESWNGLGITLQSSCLWTNLAMKTNMLAMFSQQTDHSECF
jgi:hypothetical protein